MLDRLENLVFGFNDVVEFQRLSCRKLVEYLDHHLMGRGNAPVQGFAAVGRVEPVTVGKGGADALQDALAASNGRDIVSVAPSAQACIDPWWSASARTNSRGIAR